MLAASWVSLMLRDLGCITVLHGLQMFTIKNQLSRHLKDFVRDSNHAEVGILGPLFEVGTNRINGVANENRLNKAEFVVAVTECVNVVVRHESQPQAKNHRPCH